MLKLQKCCNQRSLELASKEIRQYKYISTFYIFYHTMNYEPGILQETHSSVNSLSDVTQLGITSVPIEQYHTLFKLCKEMEMVNVKCKLFSEHYPFDHWSVLSTRKIQSARH